MPDEELLQLAGQRQAEQPAVLETQVRRMLKDPRSPHWSTISRAVARLSRALDRKKPDPLKFPTWSDELLIAMRRETLLFVGEIFREDRNLLDLIDAQFHLPQWTARRYYGIPGVDGFRSGAISLEGTNALDSSGTRRFSR
jgi:hypothetical protein